MRFQMTTPFFTINFILFAFSIASLLLLSACGGGGGGGDGGNLGVPGLSQHGSTNSHSISDPQNRNGANCMDCHTNGPGTGVFITAGTARSAIGGYVEYYSSDTQRDASTLVAKLQIDAYGNFYTVTAIDVLTPVGNVSQGAYVSIRMPDNTRRDMSPAVISHTSAGCNECHRSGGVRSPL